MLHRIRGTIRRRIPVNHRIAPSQVERRAVQPLSVLHARSSFLERIEASAPGSSCVDNALTMRDVQHEWLPLPSLDADAH